MIQAEHPLYMFQMFYFVEAKEAIEPIVSLVLESAYDRRKSQVYSIIGSHNIFIEENYPEAIVNLEKAVIISDKSNDNVSSFFAHQWSGFANYHQCHFKEAFYHFQKAHDINVATKAIYGISVSKTLFSRVNDSQGKLTLGQEEAMKAIRIAEDNDDTYSKAIANSRLGINCFHRGHFLDAETLLLKGLDLHGRIQLHANLSIVNRYLGLLYFELGRYKEAKGFFQNATTELEFNNLLPSEVNLLKTHLILTGVECDGKYQAAESMTKIVARNKLQIYHGWIRRNICEILLSAGDEHWHESEKWVKEAIEEDSQNGTIWNLALDYISYAKLLKFKGSFPKAKETLNTGLDIFQRCGADGWVDIYSEGLSSL